MKRWVQRFLVFTLLWILFLLGVRIWIPRKEGFIGAPWNGEELTYVNKGQAPWMHYPIHHSNMSDPVIKYKNAHYYEMTNEEYQNALRSTFPTNGFRASDWSEAKRPNEVMGSIWAGAYEIFLSDFEKTINSSPALKLPGDHTDIQVVHDRWIAAYTHVSDPTLLRMDVEMILYRLGKPHGKHVSMTVIAKRIEMDGVFTTEVAAIEVVGVVPEDQIALFPVVANNPFDAPQLALDETATAIIPADNEVIKELQRRTVQNVAMYETQQKLGVGV